MSVLMAFEEFTQIVQTNAQNLRTETQGGCEDERRELIQLNERLRLLLERVRVLTGEISERIKAIENWYWELINVDCDITTWKEKYIQIYLNYKEFAYGRIDYELDFELYQLQISIYKQLIENTEQWKAQKLSNLQTELRDIEEQLAQERERYLSVQRSTENVIVEYDSNALKCLKLTNDLFMSKKAQRKSHLDVEILKIHRLFFKKLYFSILEIIKSILTKAIDDENFWKAELEQFVQHKRQEFEQFYASINRLMNSYYETRIHEIEIYLEEITTYQRKLQGDEFAARKSDLEKKIEEEQNFLSIEQTTQNKLQGTMSELESVYKSIIDKDLQKVEKQKEVQKDLQENVLSVVYNIDDVRKNTVYLQTEIILYRNLLDLNGIPKAHYPLPPIDVVTETTDEVVVRNEKKRYGPVGIDDCAPNGRYITLINTSQLENIDISGWKLKRYLDGREEILFTISNDIVLVKDSRLSILSRNGNDTSKIQSYQHRTLLLDQENIQTNINSWGMGTTIKTILFDRQGNKKATHRQSIVFEGRH